MSLVYFLCEQESLNAVQTGAESVRKWRNLVRWSCLWLYPGFSDSSTFRKGACNPKTWSRLSPIASFQSQFPAFFFDLYNPNIVNVCPHYNCESLSLKSKNLHKNKAGKKVICSLVMSSLLSWISSRGLPALKLYALILDIFPNKITTTKKQQQKNQERNPYLWHDGKSLRFLARVNPKEGNIYPV